MCCMCHIVNVCMCCYDVYICCMVAMAYSGYVCYMVCMACMCIPVVWCMCHIRESPYMFDTKHIDHMC